MWVSWKSKMQRSSITATEKKIPKTSKTMKNKTCLIEWLQPLPSSFPNRGWTWQIAILDNFVVSVNKLLWHHNFQYYHIRSFMYIYIYTYKIYIYHIYLYIQYHILYHTCTSWRMICLPSKLHQSSHTSMPSTHQMGKDDLGESRWWLWPWICGNSESATPWKPSETFRNHSASSLTH